MESLVSYFGCGRYESLNNKNHGEFIVTKLRDITEKIIPFFKKYPIVGLKALDFVDWCEAAELIEKGAHLTVEGLEKIKTVKAKMNRGRK